MEDAEHANKLTFHTSCSPLIRVASRSPGVQFATADKSSGQMSVEVGTRDIRGCDSWRKGTDDGRRTNDQVSSGAARTDRQDKETKASVTGQAEPDDGCPGAMGKRTIKASEAEV